jgi:hypothetical protein
VKLTSPSTCLCMQFASRPPPLFVELTSPSGGTRFWPCQWCAVSWDKSLCCSISLSEALYTVALLNIEPLGPIIVGGKSKEVSIFLGSFPHRKRGSLIQAVQYPRTSKYSRACDISWVCEPMFDGSVHPKNQMPVFEYLPVLWYVAKLRHAL